MSDNTILMIQPSANVSIEPVIDELTRKMTAALRKAHVSGVSKGIHRCKCGKFVGRDEFELPNGMGTNALAVHYLAFHRKDIPDEELNKVENLPYGEEDPNEDELSPPPKRRD